MKNWNLFEIFPLLQKNVTLTYNNFIYIIVATKII